MKRKFLAGLILAPFLASASFAADTQMTVSNSTVKVVVSGSIANDVYCEAQKIVSQMDGPVTLDVPAGHYSCFDVVVNGVTIQSPNVNDYGTYTSPFVVK